MAFPVSASVEPVTTMATTPAARARARTASRSVSKLPWARLAPMSKSTLGSGGAQRRRDRLARSAERRKQAADHADDDGDDEAVDDECRCDREAEYDLREVGAERRHRHVVEEDVGRERAEQPPGQREDQRFEHEDRK